MLNMVGGVGQQHLPMTQRAAQHAPVGVRPKGASQEPIGLQGLPPRAIEPIGFGAAGDALGLAGIDQEHLQASGLSQFTQGNPVDPSGFHGDSGDAPVDEPIGQGGKSSGEGADTAHGLGVAPRGHGDPGLGFADVEARGVGGADLEGLREDG